MPKVFRVRYSNSTNELPGIIDLQSTEIKKVKDFRKRSIQIHQDKHKLIKETRMPFNLGQASQAFPSVKKHYQLIKDWNNEFGRM